jgi:uncharacterized protein with PIN domain
MVTVNLELVERGSEIVAKTCPHCNAELFFRIVNDEVKSVVGGKIKREDKTVQCKTCMSVIKYNVFEPVPHIDRI